MSAARPSRAPSRRLPEHPNLEQLRKQAKDLLQAFRSGEISSRGRDPALRAKSRCRHIRLERCAAHSCSRLWIRKLAQTQGLCRWRQHRAIRRVRKSRRHRSSPLHACGARGTCGHGQIRQRRASGDSLRRPQPGRCNGAPADGSGRGCAQGNLPPPRRHHRNGSGAGTRLHRYCRRH